MKKEEIPESIEKSAKDINKSQLPSNPNDRNVFDGSYFLEEANLHVLQTLETLPDHVHLLVLLCGIPGSGKSTFARKIVDTWQSIYQTTYLSSETVTPAHKGFRFQRGWISYTQDQFKSRKKMENYCYDAISKGYNVIIDRCNFDVEQRRYWIDIMYDCYAPAMQSHTSQVETSSTYSHESKILSSKPFYILCVFVPHFDDVDFCSQRAYLRGDSDGLHDADTDWRSVCARMRSSMVYPTVDEYIDGIYYCRQESELDVLTQALLFSKQDTPDTIVSSSSQGTTTY